MRAITLAAVMCLASIAPAQDKIEAVTIPTPYGGVLAGKFLEARGATAGVLFFPMCSPNSHDGWMPVAQHLQKLGVSSLILHHRGRSGDSTVATNPAADQKVADADAALEYLKSRVGKDGYLAVGGSSCGVYMSFALAARHKNGFRAVVALSGPHTPNHAKFVKDTPALAVFSGASRLEPPSDQWARELKEASGNDASKVVIADERAHGTELFAIKEGFAKEVAEWLAQRLKR